MLPKIWAFFSNFVGANFGEKAPKKKLLLIVSYISIVAFIVWIPVTIG